MDYVVGPLGMNARATVTLLMLQAFPTLRSARHVPENNRLVTEPITLKSLQHVGPQANLSLPNLQLLQTMLAAA